QNQCKLSALTTNKKAMIISVYHYLQKNNQIIKQLHQKFSLRKEVSLATEESLNYQNKANVFELSELNFFISKAQLSHDLKNLGYYYGKEVVKNKIRSQPQLPDILFLCNALLCAFQEEVKSDTIILSWKKCLEKAKKYLKLIDFELSEEDEDDERINLSDLEDQTFSD
ncbi:14544_t:CDS:2, partial [Cetraspora pellucida]